jgi:hypothetical protein
MLHRAALASLLSLAALATPARAQVGLQWKFKEGDRFYLEEKIVTRTTTGTRGQRSPSEQTQVRISSFLVKKQTVESTELEQRIESWTIKTVGPLLGANEGAKLLQEITTDVVFRIQLKPSGEILDFKGYDEVEKKLKDKGKQQAREFEAVGGREIFRAMLTMAFDVLPSARNVKTGESWKKDNLVPMGPLGDYRYSLTFTSLPKSDSGKVEAGDLIGIKGTLSFQPAKADAGELGFTVVKMDLTSNDISGKMLFDSVKGRLVTSEWTVARAGMVTLERQGEMTDFRVEGTDTRSVRLLEKKPALDQ